MTMWSAEAQGVACEKDFEKGTALGDAVYRYAEQWMLERGKLNIKQEIEDFMRAQAESKINAQSTSDARDTLEQTASTLQSSLEKLTKASAVHDKFRAVATARLKILEEDMARLVSSQIHGSAERLKRSEDQAALLETQAGQLDAQAGQLEAVNREMKQLLAVTQKRELLWQNHRYVIAGDLYRLAEGVVGRVDDLQTNHWLRETGDEGHSDTDARPTKDPEVVKADPLHLQSAVCLMGTEFEYVLRASLWDASIYIMCRFFPSEEMYLMVTVFVLNVILQTTLCSVVVYLGGESSVFADKVLHDWAIWAEEVDPGDRQGACSGSMALSTSALQWISIEAAQEYNAGPLGDLGRGQILCVVVVTVWCAICTSLLRDLGDLTIAVVALTDWTPEAQLQITREIRNFRIHKICKKRLIWMLCVVLLQSVVLFILLVWGSRWLICTSEVSDLLLNSVALGFITDTDEILFKLCVPTRVQIVTAQTEPLRVYSLRRQIPLRSLFSILSVVLFVSVVSVIFMSDQDDRRVRGLSILCS